MDDLIQIMLVQRGTARVYFFALDARNGELLGSRRGVDGPVLVR